MDSQYNLSKQERLCLKKQIDLLFSRGVWLRSKHLRLVYNLGEEIETNFAQVLFSVPKRMHKRAVKRNLLKRRLREVYRLNKSLLKIDKLERELLIAVVYSSPIVLSTDEIRTELCFLLDLVNERLSKKL